MSAQSEGERTHCLYCTAEILDARLRFRCAAWRQVARSNGPRRPTCIIAAADRIVRPRYVLLPITHAPPTDDTVGFEILPRIKPALGLDDEPSWVIVSEHIGQFRSI
jgi:hypothetical protein